MGGEVHTREEQWSTKGGDVIGYKFWYFAPDLDTLEVEARLCSAAQLQHIYHRVDCSPEHSANLDSRLYGLNANITKIELVEDAFRVHFRLENTGDEEVYIASLGKWPDGSHHLQSVGVEQEENGEWSSVGNECVEHVPVYWEILKPGDFVDGWILAVSFSEPNHRFGMCIRRIAGLKGPIRVSVRYWRNICEIQNVFEVTNPLPVSFSSSVELPRRQDP
jgi:hypothetical protein